MAKLYPYDPSEAVKDNFAPGTRWRYKKTFDEGNGIPPYRLGGREPMFVVWSSPQTVVYETRWGRGQGTETAVTRAEFLRDFEVSCCERHDREPAWKGNCNEVTVPDKGLFVVENGKVRKVRAHVITHYPYGKRYELETD